MSGVILRDAASASLSRSSGRADLVAARIGTVRAEAVAGRVAEAAGLLASVEVSRDGAEVTIAGRRLLRRMVDEPLLRVAGSLAR